MNAPLSPKPVYLPLRLVPRRKAQYAAIALQAFGLVLLAIAFSKPFEGHWQSRAKEEPVIFGLLIGVLLLAMVAVAWMLAVSVFRLLPRSPLSHVRLTWPSVAVRGPFGTRQFAWSELGRFAVVTAPNDYEVNYIVAVSADRDAGITDDRERYRHAAFRLRCDPYCSPTEAEILAGWLNEVRSAVAGRAPVDIAFFAPLALSGNLIFEPGTASREQRHG